MLLPETHPVTPPKKVPKPRSAAERKARLRRILTELDRLFPNATCALHHRNAWELLVATILSAQCTDERVNKVTPELFKAYPTPEKMAKADGSDLERLVKTTGFFRNKSKNLRGAASAIVERHGGRVPDDMEALVELRGGARKTANVVLGDAFGRAGGVTGDTHVTRLCQRLGFTEQTD